MTKKEGFGSIGVLMGGYSSEREISLRSGTAVYEALSKAGLQVKAIDLRERDHRAIKTTLRDSGIDVAFIALHGSLGEDGTIQSILEELDLPYTGPGVEASRRAFNKITTQTLLKEHGIPVADFEVIHQDHAYDLDGCLSRLGLPAVVKPPCEGSSIGISLVQKNEDFGVALHTAFEYGKEVLVERFIAGRELTASILGENVLPLIEIRSQKALFDFEAKYQKGFTEYLVPAPVPLETADLVGEIALKTYRTLGCTGLSRIDVRIDTEMRPFVLEVNTIPGFTEMSLFPKAARQAGHSFLDVCLTLLEIAYGKKKENQYT